jgi:hypothetical protein
MIRVFRVVDVRPGSWAEDQVKASSPEEAARLILGMELARGGNKRETLIAKVYSTSAEGNLSMVRLYACAQARASAPTWNFRLSESRSRRRWEEVTMHSEHEVREVEIVDNGIGYTATYYVEHGVIVAKLDDQIMRVPVGLVDPHKAVRALLAARIQRAARLSKHRDEWTSVTSETAPRGRGRPKLVRLEPET